MTLMRRFSSMSINWTRTVLSFGNHMCDTRDIEQK